MMSLPTPPGTSHRDEKENRAPRFSRVSWSETNEYHPITASPPRTLSARASTSKAGPSRPILKKKTYPAPQPPDENVKETTPEPEDPLSDLQYLLTPISRILALDASLQSLIQAYTSLTARLRNCVAGNTDADASWPLFQPIRKQREAFVQSVVRDLRQVFTNPVEESTSVTDSPTTPREPPSMSSLPSPRDSPKKKKRGMSAEDVKRARDLCGVCHAALKLLGAIFTMPALYNLFQDEELGFMLTQVLAIPLAKELPTPNARKTCALAIWVIQVQRLPSEVLEPAKDRIAYALRRGIEGELGKEGKKGSQSDGLKAIHDLALYLPSVFVPAFSTVLGSILSALLAPTLVIRSSACYALGGLALAAASLPPSEAHTQMSTTVATRLTKRPEAGPTTPSKKRVEASPTKDTPLVRTLRTTLQATEPVYSAQGPVWAFVVVAHLVVLLGPTVYLHSEVTRTITAMFLLGMRHPRSSVRGLGCLAWRAMTWAYFRPPHVKITFETDSDGDEDSATEDDVLAERRAHDEGLQANMKLLPSIVDMGAGLSTVGAFLGQETTEEIQIFGALALLRTMSRKGGPSCKDAMDMALHLLSSVSPSYNSVEAPEWDHYKLLVPGLFTAAPGLLTIEWKSLSSEVKSLIQQCPGIPETRALSLEEITLPGMWGEFLDVWKGGLSVLRMSWGSQEVPCEIREIWFYLLKAHAAPLLDDDDHSGLARLATKARDVLIDIFDDEKLNFALPLEEIGEDVRTHREKRLTARASAKTLKRPPLHHSRCSYAVKLFIVRDLFTIARAVFPEDIFAEISEYMLLYANAFEERLVGDVQAVDDVRIQWAAFCAEAAFSCDLSVLQRFWENSRENGRGSKWNAEVKAAVWDTFLDHWRRQGESRSIETAVLLLSAPFTDANSWDMSNTDYDAWNDFLMLAIDVALDHGMDTASLLDQVASFIATNNSPSSTSAVRVADLLLSNVEFVEARQVPTELLEFANDALHAAYPPAPRHKFMCMWLIRTLTRVIDTCPQELFLSMLELLDEGLRTWITDDFQVCTEDEYSADFLPLYQTILVSLQGLSIDVTTLEAVAPLLVAPFCGRKDRHVGTVGAFEEFWQVTFASREAPQDGYSEEILQCLDAVVQAQLEEQEDEAQVEDMTVMEDDVASPVDEQMFVDSDSDNEGSIVIPSPNTLARMSLARMSSTPMLRPAVFSPSMSPESPVLLASMRDSSPDDAPHSPPRRSSKMDQLSPTQPPATPKRSPGKVVSVKEKENASPIPTLSERLAIRSPLLLESILGKRPRDDTEDHLDKKAHKKSCLDVSPLGPRSTNIEVNMVLYGARADHAISESLPATDTVKPTEDDASSDVSDAEDEKTTPTPMSRKRKGVFLDAVEVPHIDSVIRTRRRRSFEAKSSTQAAQRSVSPEAPQPPLRRTRSATKLLGDEAEFQRLRYTPKKRRADRVQQLRGESSDMSSPLRSIRDAPLFGSDDSIMVASPHHAEHDLPPSDDDPHIGQVTPHRLVSPTLRRVQRISFDSDPPSDDSVLVNSPTTERMQRKIARLGGGRSRMLPSLNLRPRSASGSQASELDSDL